MYTILIVEDEFDVRENLKDLLETEGYNVLTANDGAEGYEKAMEYLPDLILSDIRMPNIDGFQLLELLQKEKDTSQIPFIFLTAKIEMGDLREGMNLGADDYIIKPFRVQELLNVINLRLRKKENNNESIIDFKKQLITRVPHELRTPLVGIIGFSDMLANEEFDLSPDDIKRMAGVINKSGKRLHKRIEKFLQYSELLSLSKSEFANVKDIEIKFELDQELLEKELKTSLKEYDRVNDVKISFEDCDLKILERFYKTILDELIENSTKFSEKGTEIRVEGFADGNYYKTKIIDNGFGMDKKSIKDIASFKQFANEIYQQEGIGIGLALVKQTLKMFDGFITIDSKKNQYTQVEFGIPLAKIEVEK